MDGISKVSTFVSDCSRTLQIIPVVNSDKRWLRTIYGKTLKTFGNPEYFLIIYTAKHIFAIPFSKVPVRG